MNWTATSAHLPPRCAPVLGYWGDAPRRMRIDVAVLWPDGVWTGTDESEIEDGPDWWCTLPAGPGASAPAPVVDMT